MTFAAVAAAGIAAAGTIAGAAISSSGAKSAAGAAAAGAQQAAAANAAQAGVNTRFAAPWINAGQSSLGSIMGGLGLGDATGGVDKNQFTHQFNTNDLQTNLAPNYTWQLGQGTDALNNQSSIAGGLVGGNALKGINDYAQNFAGNSYQNAYTNYNNNQQLIYGRLADIAGMGNTAQMSLAKTNSDLTGNIGTANMAAGQANAAGIMGSSNAYANGIGAVGGLLGNQNTLGSIYNAYNTQSPGNYQYNMGAGRSGF